MGPEPMGICIFIQTCKIMKAYLLNKEQIARLIEIGRDNSHSDRYLRPGMGYVSTDQMVDSVTKELDAEPIELDDATVSEISSPCRYFPKTHIIGFSQKDGFLKGVFVKEQ